MKPRFLSWSLMISLACSALFLAGCATPSYRISHHPEIYQRLSPADQQLVSAGQIRNDMPKDAVYLAWGQPEQTLMANVRGVPSETWIYLAYYSSYPYYPYPYRFYGGLGFSRIHGHRFFNFYYDPFYDPFFFDQRVSYPYKTVSFQNGRVVAFQFIYPPRGY